MNKSEPNIGLIIQACRENNPSGQRKLYELFYSYGMSIALRYGKNKEEAKEILNDAFVKTFSNINQFDVQLSFKQWFRVIIIHTAIDYHRKNKRFNYLLEIEDDVMPNSSYNEGWENLIYEDVIQQVQLLPPAYRTVFNLYAIEGFKHHEIAQKLNISIGASKSNYSRAKQKLQKALKNNKTNKFQSHGK